MTTAIVSKKPLVSHCTVVAGTPRSTISRGSATLMIVSLRIITKADITSSPMTNPGLACATVGPDGRGAATDGSVIQSPSHQSEEVPTTRPATGHPQTTT